jgi:hypothetical protein
MQSPPVQSMVQVPPVQSELQSPPGQLVIAQALVLVHV